MSSSSESQCSELEDSIWISIVYEKETLEHYADVMETDANDQLVQSHP